MEVGHRILGKLPSWQADYNYKLTGVMICERGRRSVTRGRDAVGWLSFSVDDTTASKSTSAPTTNTNTGDDQQVPHVYRERARSHSRWATMSWSHWSKLPSVKLTSVMWPVRGRIWCRSPALRLGAFTPEQVNHTTTLGFIRSEICGVFSS